MELEIFIDQARKLWKDISQNTETSVIPLQLEIELYKKLLVYFQLGQSCYLIFNFQSLQFDFVSEELTSVLGYSLSNVTTEIFMENIHPDERMWFLSCQQAASVFLNTISPERQMKYKLQLDYRIKKASGAYVRIMQQSVVIQNDASGNVLKTLIILTDISHIKKTGKPILSYIGMEGEPSYPEVDIRSLTLQEKHPLTKREQEIMYLLGEGKLSKQIAEELFISKHTVDVHRKNMLRKMQAGNTGELVQKAINLGLI